MISIKFSAIPTYLHSAAFYLSLDAEDADKDIQVPEHLFKSNDEVNCLEDFTQLLVTMQFWGMSAYPMGLMKYIHHADYQGWKLAAVDNLDYKSSILNDLLRIFEVSSINTIGGHLGRFERAIQCGRSELVEFWLDNNLYSENFLSDDLKSESCIAAEHDQLQCLQLLHKHGFKQNNNTIKCAARRGSLLCLKFLHLHGCDLYSDLCVEAALYGHLHILQYLHQFGVAWTEEVCSAASGRGYLNCLQFAHENGAPWTEEVVVRATSKGHLDCLKYALDNKCSVRAQITNTAVTNNQLDCLVLLRQYNAVWDETTAACAAEKGYLHILQHLHEHHCPWDLSVYTKATINGHLNCIICAHGCGLEMHRDSDRLCRVAVTAGHGGILRFFHEHGVPFDAHKTVCVKSSVRANHLEIVQYAIEQGSAWDKSCIEIAARAGHTEILRFLLSKFDCNMVDLHSFAVAAADGGQVKVLQYIVEELALDLSVDDGALFAVSFENASIDCVKYCIDKGCKFKDYEFTLGATLRSFEVRDRDFLKCIQYAMKHGWIYNNALHWFTVDNFPLCGAFIISHMKKSGK